MPPRLDTRRETRRTLLRLIGATAGFGALGSAIGPSAAAPDGPVVAEQGDQCVDLAALSGDVPVEELYDYAYPTGRFEGPPGSEGTTFSSEGTTALQRDRTSILFLYDGPEGLSLVVIHGRLDGDRNAGGTVTFTFRGLPEEARWVVLDDYYHKDGEQAASNFDRWNGGADGDSDGDAGGGDGDSSDGGDPHVVDWAYRSGRTDGGALRGLGSEFEVTIDPAFNDDAALAPDHDFGPIENWELLTVDRGGLDRLSLGLDRPVTIRTGTCGGSTADGGSD